MRSLGIGLLVSLVSAVASAQDTPPRLEFSGYTWQVLSDDEVEVESYLDREAVRLRNGAIALSDLEFENGTIEFEVATTGHRSFVGCAFRVDLEAQGYEDFYLRPHNSGRFDAMQYTPVYNGVSAWQLYPEYNQTLEIPRARWLRVKMVVSGSRLEVYFDGETAPTLVVEDLKRGRSAGTVALTSNFPAAQQRPDLYPTAFANFRIARGGAGEYATPEDPPTGFISHWMVTRPFPAPSTPIRELPADVLAADEWQHAVAEPSGLVNLARYGGIPAGAARGTVLARVRVESDRPQVKRLNFGFSDEGSIFLNRQVVFSGNNTYRSRSQRYLGVVTIDNDAVYLPLRRGTNELVFAVTEAFGGWGLIARFEDRDGIRVTAADP